MTVLAWTRYARRPFALCAMLWVVASARAYASADLTALSLEQLLDVTIVGASKYEQKQGEVAAAVSVITRQEIQSFGWHTLGEALSSLPGVYTTYDHQYSYFGMRGFGLPGDLNTRVLITINGNRVNDPTFDAGPTGADFPLDMDVIERIEFIPGPGGAVYGQNAMLGVVNVITRSGAGINGGELAATYEDPQALREGRASWGTILDNGIDLFVSASAMRARGEDRFFDYGASGVSGIAVGMDGERNKQFFARIARGPWTFEQVYADHLKDDPTGAYLSDPLVAGSYQTDRHTLTQLRFDDTLAGNTLQVSARLFAGTQNYNSLLTFAGVPTSSPADSAWRGGELRVLFLTLAKHKLLLGVEGQDNARENQAADNWADPTQNYFLARTGYRIGVYVQDEWRIAETLTATLGLREDRNNMTGTQASPRAALIWQTTPETTLKALYGIAHRAPNVYERDYGDGTTQAANLSLGGESIDTLEFVADHRIGRDLTLRASAYQWTMQDVISLGIDPISGLSQYQSGENVKARGLELSADQTWSFGARLRGSVSAQDAAYADGRDLLNSPRRLGKLNLSSPLPWFGLRAGFEAHYDGKRLSLDGSRLGGYVLSNLLLSTDRIAPGVVLSVGVYNLFDRRYAQPGADTNWQNAFQQDGRSVQLKLQFNF